MFPRIVTNSLVALAFLICTASPVFADTSISLKSYYSPIVKLEANNGYFLITTDSGIQWIQVEDPGKEHLKTLEVGDMIDVVVQLRPDPDPPLLKSWKLARSASPCTIFNGQICSTE